MNSARVSWHCTEPAGGGGGGGGEGGEVRGNASLGGVGRQ